MDDQNQLTKPIEKLITAYQEGLKQKAKKEGPFIHVDEIASKVAHFYERIRKIVDWKEENLLRRNAIERILKRSFITEISKLNFVFQIKPREIAEPLVLELIRGGHLPNDEVPQSVIFQVISILEKYGYFLQNAPFDKSNSSFLLKKRINFYEWILEIAACEMEDVLAPPFKENALMETMSELMDERINLKPSDILSAKEKTTQTYIAVHRTLFDLDDSIITYHLLLKKFPQWQDPSPELVAEINKNIFSIWEELESELSHPLAKDFLNLCERTDTSFTLLGDLLDSFKKEPETISDSIENKENLRKLVSRFYNQRLASLKSRLFKIAIFSTLSVFVSNWFTFFIVEVPLAHLFYEGFSPLAAAFDFVIPSIAMFVLVSIIKPPSSDNLFSVVKLTDQFVYQNEEKDHYEIRPKKKRRLVTYAFIFLLYLIATFVSFGTIAWLFYLAKIPTTSILLDTIQIAMNVFAALVVRNKAKEITVEEKSSFGEFFLDILSLPVAEIGSWVADKWKEYNLVSVFFNVIIEIPFVNFIEFIEDWRQFLKEKKAQIH